MMRHEKKGVEGRKKWEKIKKQQHFFADGYYKRQLCARRKRKFMALIIFFLLGEKEAHCSCLLAHKSP